MDGFRGLFDEELLKEMHSRRATTQGIAQDVERFLRLAEIDTEMALVRARKILEQLLTDVAKVMEVTPEVLQRAKNERPGYKPTINDYIFYMQRNNILADRIVACCHNIRANGNLGAHFLEEMVITSEHEKPSRDTVEVVAGQLKTVLKWYVYEFLPRKLDRLRYTIVSGREVTDRAIRDALEMDALFFPEELQGRFEVSKAWHNRNSEVFILGINPDNGKVVGCITALPVEDAAYEQLLSGSLADLDLPVNTIRRYGFPDWYRLYLSAVVIDPEYQDTMLLKGLLTHFANKLCRLADKEILVSEIATDAISDDGRKLAEYLGMEKVGETRRGSVTYRLRFLPKEERTTHARRMTDRILAPYEEKLDKLIQR